MPLNSLSHGRVSAVSPRSFREYSADKVFAHLCKRAGEALKLAVISPERRRLQSLLAPETGTDAQRVYLFRECAGDSRKAA